jgi:hypothetical protein
MLDPLPFDEAVAILENLQNQFKAGGWEPWEVDDSAWFDLTPEGKKRLYARMFERGYMESASLRVPKMYGMTFRLKCNEGCWTREPPYLFLIDIGIGGDVYGREPGEPRRWELPAECRHWQQRATKFAALSYQQNVAATLATSPMLDDCLSTRPCHSGESAKPVQGRRVEALGGGRQHLVRPDAGG